MSGRLNTRASKNSAALKGSRGASMLSIERLVAKEPRVTLSTPWNTCGPYEWARSIA